MLYLGLDVHSKWMTIKGFDPQTGEVALFDRVPNDPGSLKKVFGQLQGNGPLSGAMESGTNAWSIYRDIERYFEELVVVDPATVWGKETRRIAKTDQRDAMNLAQKLAKQQLVELYVPDSKTQDRRNLVRAKVRVTQQITKLVSEIGSLLRSWGIIVDCSLLSKKGTALIEQSKGKLPMRSLQALDLWVGMLEKAQEAERELDKAIIEEVKGDENCQILMSMPGVGAFTALLVCAEIGDIRRFATPEQLISYCGLAPSVSASAGKVYYGKLSKFCNKFLRYALVLRAQGMAKLKVDNPFRRTYWRVVLKNHRNDAKIAVARQLVRVIYSMLKNGQYWDPERYKVEKGGVALAICGS